MENNQEKVNLMMNMLSSERKAIIEVQVNDTVNSIKKNQKNHDTVFKIELTHDFGAEEPRQYVWISFKVTMSPIPFMIPTPQGTVQFTDTFVQATDMDVYLPDDINDWLDHVDRLNKQTNLYLEKQGKVEQSIDDEKNKIKVNLSSVIHDKLNDNELSDDEDTESENELMIEQQWMFSDLFASVRPEQRTKEAYLNIFNKHTALLLNRIMDTHINMEDDDNVDGAYNHVHHGLVTLISEFEKCDFTVFNKKELETLGFINWRNNIMLIPLWAFPIILKNNIGLSVKHIHDFNVTVGTDYIPIDDKNGMMSVGFPFSVEDKVVNFKFEYLK